MKQESASIIKNLAEKHEYPMFFQMESSLHQQEHQPYTSAQELIFADYLALRINVLLFHIYSSSENFAKKQRTFYQLNKSKERNIKNHRKLTYNLIKNQQKESIQKLLEKVSQDQIESQNESQHQLKDYDYLFKKCLQMYYQAQNIKQSIMERGNFDTGKRHSNNQNFKSNSFSLGNQKLIFNEEGKHKNIQLAQHMKKYQPINRKYSISTKRKSIQQYLSNPTEQNMKSITNSLDISLKVFKLWLKKHRLNLKKAQLIKAVQQLYLQKQSDSLCSLKYTMKEEKDNYESQNYAAVQQKITLHEFRDLARRVYNNKNFGAITRWCQQFIIKNSLQRFCSIELGEKNQIK